VCLCVPVCMFVPVCMCVPVCVCLYLCVPGSQTLAAAPFSPLSSSHHSWCAF
jgi:hypothetical protein